MECWISELDLSGILFADYPDDLSLEESRERLELDIEEACEEFDPTQYVEDVDILSDGSAKYNGKTFCINPPRISAYTVFLVSSLHAHRELERLTPYEYKNLVDAFWRKRAELFDDKRKALAKQKETNHA